MRPLFSTLIVGLFLVAGSLSPLEAQQAGFTLSSNNPCTRDTVTLTDTSTGTPAAWRWIIIVDGNPTDTLTGQGPHQIVPGPGLGMRVQLRVDGSGGLDSSFQDVNLRPSPNASIFVFGQNPFCASDGVLLSGGFHSRYLWSTGDTTNSISVRVSGSFWVKVTDANGCSAYDTVETTAIPGPDVDIVASGPLEFCQGDSVVLDGGAHIDHFWNGRLGPRSIAVKQGGRYILVATDSTGCGGADTVEVTVFPPPNPLLQGNPFFCEGDSVAITLAGFQSVRWSTGDTTPTITLSETDTVSAFVVDSRGCEGSLSPTVIQEIPTPVPVIRFNNLGIPETTPFATYQWAWLDTMTGQTTPVPGGNSQDLTGVNYITNPANQGALVVIVTDAFGCTGQSDFVNIPLTVGLESTQSEWVVWPNPATEVLFVDIPASSAWELTISGLDGKVHRYQSGLPGGQAELSLKDIAPGMYILRLRNSRQLLSQPIIILKK